MCVEGVRESGKVLGCGGEAEKRGESDVLSGFGCGDGNK